MWIIMGKRIIYIICHNDGSEKKAHEHFDKYSWARIYRIPKESQTHLMESVMYKTELMKVYDEWKDADIVGTLSYKLPDIVYFIEQNAIGFDKCMRKLDYWIQTTIPKQQVYGLIFSYNSQAHMYKKLRPILEDTCNKIGITTTTTTTSKTKYYNPLKRKIETPTTNIFEHYTYMFHNYWMTTPNIMLNYINFFNTRWLPALESHPNIFENSNYKYNTSLSNIETTNEELLLYLTKGRCSHYPYHAIACERFINIYCIHSRIDYLGVF